MYLIIILLPILRGSITRLYVYWIYLASCHLATERFGFFSKRMCESLNWIGDESLTSLREKRKVQPVEGAVELLDACGFEDTGECLEVRASVSRG